MKLDLFNKETWNLAPPIQTDEANRNRALGSIGHKIVEVRRFKLKIEKQFGVSEQYDYNIAETLRLKNNLAFTLMQIKYEMSNIKVQEALELVNGLLELWKDANTRNDNWQILVSMFETLTPYLEQDPFQKKSKDVFAIKVNGNEAWIEYLELAKNVSELKTDIEQDNYNRQMSEGNRKL